MVFWLLVRHSRTGRIFIDGFPMEEEDAPPSIGDSILNQEDPATEMEILHVFSEDATSAFTALMFLMEEDYLEDFLQEIVEAVRQA